MQGLAKQLEVAGAVSEVITTIERSYPLPVLDCTLQDENVALQDEIGVLKPILEDLPVGLVIVSERGAFTVFNAEAKRILGIGAQRVPANRWAAVYGCYLPDKATLFPAERIPLARALCGESVANELMFVRNERQPDGIWVRVSARPLPSSAGEQARAVAAFADVTEHRKVVEEIDLLSRAVEQTADSVVITDETGRITYVNPAFEATTGYTREEAMGNTPRMLKSGLHDRGFYEDLWATILAGNPFRGTLRNRKKNGELYWAEQTITPIFGNGGNITHFVSVLKDITESRRQQEQQIKLRLAREVQQRLYVPPVSFPGLDVGAAVHPAEQTGGDYVDFISTLDDGQDVLGVAVGDVGGHGFDAALVMALTRAYVRSFWQQGLGVGKVTNAVNRSLLADLDEGRLVTLLLTHLDFANGVLSYASAGHVPGFVLNRDGAIDTVMESTGVPLGVLPGYRFGTKFVPLHSGQVIVLLTDGITEAGDAEQFGSERTLSCVREHLDEPAQRIAESVYEAIGRFAKNERPQDDMSVVILKVD